MFNRRFCGMFALMIIAVPILITFGAAGCASYATPGRGADLTVLGATPQMQAVGTDGTIRQAFDRKPLANFPTSIAVVRVQASGYHSRTAQSWGVGRYSVVTTRDVEPNDAVDRLSKLPMVRGIAPINRLLLAGDLQDDRPLREAAARLQADVLLVYTIDTTFHTEDKMRPLSVISLGLSPNKQVRLTTTASALLLDTRNGYVYGLAEATDQNQRMTNAWQNDVAVDEARRATESAAFKKLVGEVETAWKGIVAQYAKS